MADEPAPPSSHVNIHSSQDVNPLVQKLEKAAISDPRIQQQGVPSFAPPPTTTTTGPPQNFAPMAYNPAAPPEAEKYQHREKTPPPEDDGHNPLVVALAHDKAAPFSPAYGQTTFSAPPGAPSLPGPPPQGYPGPTSPGLPPSAIASPGFPPSQFGHLQRAATVPTTGMASPGLTSPYGANFPGTPSFAPPPPPPTAPAAATAAVVPPGGYSQFNYAMAAHQASTSSDYGIHQQLYRPTEQEHAAKYVDYRPKPETHGSSSKLGQGAERLERGVTGMLKKFEKKFA